MARLPLVIKKVTTKRILSSQEERARRIAITLKSRKTPSLDLSKMVNTRLIRRGDVVVSVQRGGSNIIAKMSFSKVSHSAVFISDLKNEGVLKTVDYKLFQGGKIKKFDLPKKGAKFKILRWRHATPQQIETFAYNSERIQQLRKRYDGWLVAFGYLPERIIQKMFGKKVEILHEGVRKFFTCSENFGYAAAPPEWAIKELGLRPVKLLPDKYAKNLDDIIPGTIENEMVKEGILEVIPGASYWPKE